MSNGAKRVVIFIPGIMGSVLSLNGEVIWPGPVSSLVLPYKKMKELMRPDLHVDDVIRSVSVSVQYGEIIKDLTKWGFIENQTLFLCPYDWRKSNEGAVSVLADVIDRGFAENGNTAEITIIAHSMGGLISRYYLESGKFDARPGFSSVRNLFTLGTPHRGAPLALTAAMGMEKRLFLSATQVHQLVSDPQYPALYQLMPSPSEPFAWDQSAGKQFPPMNVYDPGIAADLGLVTANLQAAAAFRAVLDACKPPARVRYFFFVGTRQVTTSFVYVRATKVTRMDVEDAGDGTVPSWSGGLGSGVQSQPVGGEHSTIYKNDELRRTLAPLLGYTGILAAVAAAGGVEVALRERVVEPNDVVHLALTPKDPGPELKGHIRLRRAKPDAAGNLGPYSDYGNVLLIAYSGMDAEKLNVAFNAPDANGIYKVIFESEDNVMRGEDDLFVQEPAS